MSSCKITNEPKWSAIGVPDYIITRNDIAISYIEAGDIHKNLDDKGYKELLGDTDMPASTLVSVPSLGLPEWGVEIEAIAVVNVQ